MFLTTGREDIFRFFSWLSFTYQWVGMVVPLAPRNFKWFVRFRFSKLKRLKKELAKMILSFWSQGARRDISWVCSAQFNDGWWRLIERNERDWKWSFRICSISDLICKEKTIYVEFIIGNKKIMKGFLYVVKPSETFGSKRVKCPENGRRKKKLFLTKPCDQAIGFSKADFWILNFSNLFRQGFC